jgi:hypothetical protein
MFADCRCLALMLLVLPPYALHPAAAAVSAHNDTALV